MGDSCKLCHKEEARYTCPRCNVRYCSISCYRCKQHESCSETFYRECFIEGLADFNSTDDDRTKMVAMLQRLDGDVPQPESDDDDDDEPDLADRMADLDLDNDTDEMWKRLTPREKAEFTKMVEDGRLSTMVTLWEPWWRHKDESKVEEVGQKVGQEVGQSGTRPQLVHTPQLDTLTKAQLSPNIPYSIINILYGYVYLTRLHNGSHGDTPTQMMKELEVVSEALSSRTFDDVPSALHACLQSLQNKAKSNYVSREFEVGVLCDLKSLLEGVSERDPLLYAMTALSDIHHIANAAVKDVKKDMKRAKEESDRRAQLTECKKRWFAAQKKVEFLLSWCHKYGLRLRELAPQVDLTFCLLSTEMARHDEDQKKLEEAWGGKQPPKKHPLIEEIN